MRRLLLFILFCVFMGALLILVSGSPILTVDLSGKDVFPFGTLVSWTGIIALPSFFYYAFPSTQKLKSRLNQFFKWIFRCLVIISIFWGLIGFALAGNWAFTFSGSSEGFRGGNDAGNCFLIISIINVFLPCLIIISYGILLFMKRIIK